MEGTPLSVESAASRAPKRQQTTNKNDVYGLT